MKNFFIVALVLSVSSTSWATIGNLVTSFSDGYSRLKTSEVSVTINSQESEVHDYNLVTLSNEYHAAGLRLTNKGNSPVVCSITLAGLDDANEFTYVIRKQEFLYTYYYNPVPPQPGSPTNKISDPLCLLPQSGGMWSVTVPAYTRIKLYVGIHVLAAASGINNATITVQTPGGSEQLNLTLNVMATAPTESLFSYDVYMWPWVSVGVGLYPVPSQTSPAVYFHAPDLAAADMESHGAVSMSFPSMYAAFSATGDLIAVDYTPLDVRLMNYGAFVDKFILFWEGQYEAFPVGSMDSTTYLTPHSTAWNNAFSNYLRAWLDHAAQLGFGTDRFGIIPDDEPASASFATAPDITMTNYISMCNLIRAVDPNLPIYLTLTDYAGITDLNTMLPYVNVIAPVWPYRTFTLTGQTPGYNPRTSYYSTLLPAMKAWRNAAPGREIRSYHVAGGSSDPELLGNRAYAVLMVGEGTGDGITGAGTYAYNVTTNSSWDATDGGSGGLDFSFIYDGTENQASNLALNPTRERLVPSLRWECLRAGIQDAQILLYLKEVKSLQVPAVQTQIQAILDEAANMAYDVTRGPNKWDGGIVQQNDAVIYYGWVTYDYIFNYAKRVRQLYASVNPNLCSYAIPGDLNKDCKVDFADFAILASEWLNCNLGSSQLCSD